MVNRTCLPCVARLALRSHGFDLVYVTEQFGHHEVFR